MIRSSMLHIGYLEPHPDNVREDLGDIRETAASIKAHGIIQPLVIVPRADKSGHYYVIAGNRRLAAARLARQEQIPVIIRRDDLTDEQVTEIMLIENYHRADLNPMEKAEAMARLRKAGKTSQQIARALGISDACGQCWETVIRQDERVVQAVAPPAVIGQGITFREPVSA